MKYWVTTDLHLGHEEMVTKCGRPKNYEKQIFNRMLECIKPNDVLICLGDVCIGSDAHWNSYFTSLVICKKWLVRGNHDKKSDHFYAEHGWDSVCHEMVIERHGMRIVFSHMPSRNVDRDINVHGHYHDYKDHRHYPPSIDKERCFLVSLEDTKYSPINLENIIIKFNQLRRV